MKKFLNILNMVFSGLSVLCIFFGFYMAFNYIAGNDKNMTMFAIFMAIGAFGLLGLGFEALLIYRKKTKNNK